MLQKMRQRANEESGFTLIELLVVILIIGILAAIAIPSFINQKSKANDASAKELARTGQTVAETIATDNAGSYANVSASNLVTYEPSINTTSGNGNAYISSVTANGTTGYTIVATSTAGQNYTIIRNGGAITRSCTTAGSGGCPPAGTW